MDKDMILELERESDAPENWEANTIFVRDGKGNVLEVEIPDDEEE